jgi:hypothetical protein
MALKLIDLSTTEERTRSLYRVVGYTSLAIFIIAGLYGMIEALVLGIDVIGLSYVTKEFPPMRLFGVGAKPTSWMFVSGILLLYSTLELHKRRIMNLGELKYAAIKMFAFVIFGISLYEIFFNFTFWSGIIAADAVYENLNPDLIINPFPNPNTPWSVVFATKMFVMLTILSGYYIYFLNQHEKDYRSRKQI